MNVSSIIKEARWMLPPTFSYSLTMEGDLLEGPLGKARIFDRPTVRGAPAALALQRAPGEELVFPLLALDLLGVRLAPLPGLEAALEAGGRGAPWGAVGSRSPGRSACEKNAVAAPRRSTSRSAPWKNNFLPCLSNSGNVPCYRRAFGFAPPVGMQFPEGRFFSFCVHFLHLVVNIKTSRFDRLRTKYQ